MRKLLKILKRVFLGIAALLIILFAFGYWFISLLAPMNSEAEQSLASDLPYLSKDIVPIRGKILAVVTSTDTMGSSGKSTGYELTELSRAYYVFSANGFEVDIASPLGGKPPVVIDDEDMGVYDYAFLNDSRAQVKANNTLTLKEVNSDDYAAIYFVGGKGAMYDFPDNEYIQSIVRDLHQSNRVVGAVCHGPAALVNVTLDDSTPLLKNRKVSSFTNKEELLLISDAELIFPFLLQTKLVDQGAVFKEGAMYLENVSHDGNLVTGQNPWSTWLLAETMIKQMGYSPKPRPITDEENAINVLKVYQKNGKQQAKAYIERLLLQENKPLQRNLIAQHSIVAVMRGEISGFFDILNLTSFAKSCEEKKNRI